MEDLTTAATSPSIFSDHNYRYHYHRYHHRVCCHRFSSLTSLIPLFFFRCLFSPSKGRHLKRHSFCRAVISSSHHKWWGSNFFLAIFACFYGPQKKIRAKKFSRNNFFRKDLLHCRNYIQSSPSTDNVKSCWCPFTLDVSFAIGTSQEFTATSLTENNRLKRHCIAKLNKVFYIYLYFDRMYSNKKRKYYNSS